MASWEIKGSITLSCIMFYIKNLSEFSTSVIKVSEVTDSQIYKCFLSMLQADDQMNGRQNNFWIRA